MGTRALTFVHDEQGNKIINLYRQYDGYPEGHGAELAEFLGEVQVQGFNGMGCLSAQLVANFKQGAGGFYLEPVTAEDCGQDFEYHVQRIDDQLVVKVFNCGVNFFGMTQDETYEPIFEGNLTQFTEFCKEKAVA
jgi:hypothetical protein